MTTATRPLASSTHRRVPAPWAVVAGLTTAVIVLSTVRGLANGFEPIGDNALMELRAWDVFTSDRPLLGTWSSASNASGLDLNHPGPLLFDYFALLVRVLGGRLGLAIGAAALNITAVWGSVLVARRVGGATAALATALAAAVLAWTMGSELLFDVWQPNILVLAFFAFLVLVWAVWCGHARALPVAVVVGSVCVQAHVSYLFLAPALLVAGVISLFVRDGAATWSSHRRPLLLALTLGVVAWAQPLWEQLAGDGQGNLQRLVTSSGSEGARNGVGTAVRMLAAVLAVPPWWSRPGYDSAIPISPWEGVGEARRVDLDGLPALPMAVLALGALAAVLVALFVLARRHGDDVTPPGIAVVAVAAVVAVFTATITPIDPALGVLPHKVRWLWSLGAFTGAVVVGALLRAAQRRSPITLARASWGVVAAALLASALTIPTHRAADGPVSQPEAWALSREVRRQLGPVEDLGTVFFDLEGLVFAEPYSWALMAELARRDVPFRLAAESDIRQVGEGRRFLGDADVRLYYRTGADADVVPPGATRVAYVPSDGVRGSVAVFVEPFGPAGG